MRQVFVVSVEVPSNRASDLSRADAGWLAGIVHRGLVAEGIVPPGISPFTVSVTPVVTATLIGASAADNPATPATKTTETPAGAWRPGDWPAAGECPAKEEPLTDIVEAIDKALKQHRLLPS